MRVVALMDEAPTSYLGMSVVPRGVPVDFDDARRRLKQAKVILCTEGDTATVELAKAAKPGATVVEVPGA